MFKFLFLNGGKASIGSNTFLFGSLSLLPPFSLPSLSLSLEVFRIRMIVHCSYETALYISSPLNTQ